MNRANVNLSDKELLMVTDTDWILTKHHIIAKVYNLFGDLSTAYQALNLPEIPAEVTAISPKIYKGEQYLQLPYVMMDFPRFFKGPDTFAVRHLFWWGNYFSITLQLAGLYKLRYQQMVAKHYHLFASAEWSLCINDDVWSHVFEAGNYRAVKDFKEEEWVGALKGHPFIKLAKKIPLNEWDKSYEFFMSEFCFLMKTACNEVV